MPAASAAASAASTPTSSTNAGAARRPGHRTPSNATIVPVRSAAFAAAAASRIVPMSSHVVVATIRAQHSGGRGDQPAVSTLRACWLPAAGRGRALRAACGA